MVAALGRHIPVGHSPARSLPFRGSGRQEVGIPPVGSGSAFAGRGAQAPEHSSIFYQWRGTVAEHAWHAREVIGSGYRGIMATGGIMAWVVYERPPIEFWWEF